MSRHACRHALCLRAPTANGFGTFCWGDLQKELVSSNSHAPAEFWSHRLRRRQAPQCSTKDGGRARRGTSHIDPAWCPKLDRLFYPIHSPKCDCGTAACDRGCILFALGAGVPHWRCLWVGDEPTRCHQNAAHARRWQRRHSRRCGAISAPHPYWWCGARNSVSLCLCVSVSLCLRVSVCVTVLTWRGPRIDAAYRCLVIQGTLSSALPRRTSSFRRARSGSKGTISAIRQTRGTTGRFRCRSSLGGSSAR